MLHVCLQFLDGNSSDCTSEPADYYAVVTQTCQLNDSSQLWRWQATLSGNVVIYNIGLQQVTIANISAGLCRPVCGACTFSTTAALPCGRWLLPVKLLALSPSAECAKSACFLFCRSYQCAALASQTAGAHCPVLQPTHQCCECWAWKGPRLLLI